MAQRWRAIGRVQHSVNRWQRPIVKFDGINDSTVLPHSAFVIDGDKGNKGRCRLRPGLGKPPTLWAGFQSTVLGATGKAQSQWHPRFSAETIPDS